MPARWWWRHCGLEACIFSAPPVRSPSPCLPARPPAPQVIDDKECNRRAEEAKARNEPHFYMMEMAPGQQCQAGARLAAQLAWACLRTACGKGEAPQELQAVAFMSLTHASFHACSLPLPRLVLQA